MALGRLLFKIALSCVVILLSASLSEEIRAQAQTISINEKRIQIAELIKLIGEATQRTILFDDRVRGTVSVVAKRPVTLDEAWSMLDSSLALLGFSLLPSTEGSWRIAKVGDAIGEAPFVHEVAGVRDTYVTSLIPLRVATPAAVMAVLEPLSGASVTLIPLEATNSLIASGPERRIARLTTIADSLDRVEEREVRYRVIRHRNVENVAGWIESFFDSGALSRIDLEVWSDARTNSLIYRGTEDATEELVERVDRIDRPIEGSGQIQVLKVLNRDPGEVAELIEKLHENRDTGRGQIRGLDGQLSQLMLSDYSIVVDERTRSLIVRADLATQAAIRQLLEILDQTPQLLAVDLIITEIQTPRVFSLGFAFSIPLTAGDEVGDLIARLVSTPGGTGLAAGLGAETTLLGRVDQDLNVPFVLDDGTGIAIPIANTGVIDVGEFQVYTEVLIQPSLILTAGDSHEIFVGDNVPVPVGAGAGAIGEGSTDNLAGVLSRRTVFERKDVGITIGIDATASRVGSIKLDLDIEISRLVPSLAGNIALVGPTFSEQKIIVNAILNDGEIAIIAVNRGTSTMSERQGTPFLSSIPLLGALFTRTVEIDEDVRLILGARVRRIGSPAELAADSIRRRLAFERRNARNASLPIVGPDEPAYAVLVTTRSRRDDADAIAEGLDLRGFATQIHRWTLRDSELFDVYVTSLESMADAAEVASTLSREGWDTDLTLLPTRS
ncbi:MAG: secretin N-terminal domain-containing protein [Myxococcota bacterium]